MTRTTIVSHGARWWVATAAASGAIGGTTLLPVLGTVVGGVCSLLVGLPAAALATCALALATRPGTSARAQAAALHLITGALVLASITLATPILGLLWESRDLDGLVGSYASVVTIASAVILLVVGDLRVRRLLVLARPAPEPPGPGPTAVRWRGGASLRELERTWIGGTVVAGLLVAAWIGHHSYLDADARRQRATNAALTTALDALGLEPISRSSSREEPALTDCPGGVTARADLGVGAAAPFEPLADALRADGWQVDWGRTGGAAIVWLLAERGEVRLEAIDRGDLSVQAEAGCERSFMGLDEEDDAPRPPPSTGSLDSPGLSHVRRAEHFDRWAAACPAGTGFALVARWNALLGPPRVDLVGPDGYRAELIGSSSLVAPIAVVDEVPGDGMHLVCMPGDGHVRSLSIGGGAVADTSGEVSTVSSLVVGRRAP